MALRGFLTARMTFHDLRIEFPTRFRESGEQIVRQVFERVAVRSTEDHAAGALHLRFADIGNGDLENFQVFIDFPTCRSGIFEFPNSNPFAGNDQRCFAVPVADFDVGDFPALVLLPRFLEFDLAADVVLFEGENFLQFYLRFLWRIQFRSPSLF